jgi:integrase
MIGKHALIRALFVQIKKGHFCPRLIRPIRLSYRTMRRRLDEWIRLSMSPTFTHHDLRHSCVSLLASAGFNDFQAAKRMGHDVKIFNENLRTFV